MTPPGKMMMSLLITMMSLLQQLGLMTGRSQGSLVVGVASEQELDAGRKHGEETD